MDQNSAIVLVVMVSLFAALLFSMIVGAICYQYGHFVGKNSTYLNLGGRTSQLEGRYERLDKMVHDHQLWHDKQSKM